MARTLDRVTRHLDVIEDIRPSLFSGRVDSAFDAFALWWLEKALMY
jgi:hypothetical protein